MKNLDKITQTVEGYPIKDLRFKSMDNLFVGLVQDPVCGNPNLREGFVSCVWRKNGTVEPRYGGTKRSDLNIDIKLLRE